MVPTRRFLTVLLTNSSKLRIEYIYMELRDLHKKRLPLCEGHTAFRSSNFYPRCALACVLKLLEMQ